MQIRFDVIITTLNRADKVRQLINQLLVLIEQQRIVGKIILVDSSKVTYSAHQPSAALQIIRSSHQNQPYQRFLGLAAAQQDYVLYLDDDMEIIDDTFCEDLAALSIVSLTGVNLKFKNDNFFLDALDNTIMPKNKMSAFLRTLSGYPVIEDNTVWLAGIKGNRRDGIPVEFVSGGSFLAHRALLYTGISTTLFDSYEKGLGKGEDMITGFALSRKGVVHAHEKVYFYHNDQRNSVYSASHYLFTRRVAYSRLMLSFEYANLKGHSLLMAFLHYLWYAAFRVAGMVLNFVFKPSKAKKHQITGYIAGVFFAVCKLSPHYFLARENTSLEYWNREVSSDLQSSSG